MNTGYSLYYYGNGSTIKDYAPISGTNPFSNAPTGLSTFKSLYNGNIAGSSVNIPQLTSGAYWIDRLYTYDQLNRIKSSTVYHSTSMTGTPTHYGDYDEQFTYDGNGNILSVNRAGSGTGTLKDILAYNYNRDVHGSLLNNQLNYLNGHAYASNITPDQSVNNYAYDPIGELTKDVQSGITSISWNVYGKIDTIKKAAGNITFTYNPGGQRVTKTSGSVTTYYIRDAQGNPLALYDNQSSVVNWREQHLYGSSRLGMWIPNVKLGTDSAIVSWDTIGRKQYELSNHLGNVLATITDKRLQHLNSGNIDYFNADVATAQDYYAFGSLMPGRQYNYAGLYPNGFNGKRNDNDIAGTGNWQDYGQRMYLPWVGRFPSTDPLSFRYADLSAYQFSGDSPVKNIDLDGLEPASVTAEATKTTTKIVIRKAEEVGTKYAVDASGRLITQSGGSTMLESLGVGGGKLLGAAFGAVINVMTPVPNDPNSAEAIWMRQKFAGNMANAIKNNFEIHTSDPSTLSDQYLIQVRERIATGKAYPSDYKYAKEANARFGGQNVSDVPEDKGIVYLRIDKTGNLKPYIGQAKNVLRYKERQREHVRANPDAVFEFEIIATGIPGTDLTRKEQEAIDALGGVTNKKNPEGGTSNQRNPGKSLFKQDNNGRN